MSERIRWRDGDDITGNTGVCGPFAFQIYRMYAGPKWLLRAELPGMGDTHAESDDPEVLKAEAEKWLERFVSSLGAVFPPGPVISRCECGGLASHQHGCRWRQGYGSLIEAVIDEPAKEADR